MVFRSASALFLGFVVVCTGCNQQPAPRDLMAGVKPSERELVEKALKEAGITNKIVGIFDRGEHWDVAVEPVASSAQKGEGSSPKAAAAPADESITMMIRVTKAGKVIKSETS